MTVTSLDTDRDLTFYFIDITDNRDSIDNQAVSESDVSISEGSEKPRPRRGHLSSREGSLRSEVDSFIPVADFLRQSRSDKQRVLSDRQRNHQADRGQS